MDLSDEDRQRLDELARLRDCGEISNEEYQRRSWNIIKEKDQGAESPRTESTPLRSSTQAKKPEGSLRNAPSGVLPPQMRQTPFGREQAGLDAHISMSGVRQRGKTSILSALLFPKNGLFIVRALIILLVSASLTMLVLYILTIKPPRPTPPKPIERIDELYYFIQPIFGSLAVKTCKWRCGIRTGDMKTACKRGCGGLSLRNYARRITLEDIKPRKDAEEIFSRCLEKEIEHQTFYTREEWEHQVRNALNVLNEIPTESLSKDEGRAGQLFTLVTEANNQLKYPPDAREEEIQLSQGLIRATCLRANLILTEMAIAVTQNHSDEFSARFYLGLHRELKPRTIDVENTMVQGEKAKELLRHGAQVR